MIQQKFHSKLFLWLPIFLLLIFCIDIYFTVPNADDYDFFLWIKKYGFWGFQKRMYLQQNGRFVASFFIACYSSLFNFINIYWIFSLCFFLVLYYSFFLFIRILFRYLNVEIKALTAFGYAAYLMLFCILVCKELSSFLFWMPGIINYQLVVIFFILGVTYLIKLQFKKQRSSFILSLLCFALASGLHELFFLLVIPLLLYFFISLKKPLRSKLFLIIVVVFIPFIISFFSPGTGIRQIQTASSVNELISIIIDAITHVFFLFGQLVTMPYMYIFLIAVFMFFRSVNSLGINSFFNKIKLKYLIALLILQPALIFFITIKKISSGLPERAENLLLLQAAFVLILIVVKLAVSQERKPLSDSPYIFYFLLFFLCIASQNMIDGFKGILSGYFYNEISQSRLKSIYANGGAKSLYLLDYQDELNSFYKRKYKKPIPLKLLKIVEKNKIILFSDVYDLPEGQINSFRQYHHIDTIKMPAKISFGDTLIYLPQIKNRSY